MTGRVGRRAHRWVFWLAGAVGLIGGGVPQSAQATLLRAFTLPELVQRADLIVIAELGDGKAQWDQGRIYTHTQARVLERLKGKAIPVGERITIRQLGGTVDGKVLAVAGTPALPAGARGLLFLRQDPRQRPFWYIVGFSQGLYWLTDPAQDAKEAKEARDSKEALASRPTESVLTPVQGAPAPAQVRLDQVRALVARAEGGR